MSEDVVFPSADCQAWDECPSKVSQGWDPWPSG